MFSGIPCLDSRLFFGNLSRFYLSHITCLATRRGTKSGARMRRVKRLAANFTNNNALRAIMRGGIYNARRRAPRRRVPFMRGFFSSLDRADQFLIETFHFCSFVFFNYIAFLKDFFCENLLKKR
jgi:hypothetical protein